VKSRAKELLDSGIHAMMAAVEIYNKPNFPYRTDSFAILAITAWEKLLKAKWLTEHKLSMKSLYIYEARGKSGKQYIKKNRTGYPFTQSADSLAKKLIEQQKLDVRIWNNIQILIELRDNSIHFYNKSPGMITTLQAVGTACLKNFATATIEWFDRPLSEFELHLMPLAIIHLPNYCDGVVIHPEEEHFMNFVREMSQISEKNLKSPYFVTVNIEVTFTKSNAINALAVRSTNDPNALPIQLTEENIRSKYPWDHTELTQKCRNRYANFKADPKYHSLIKSLKENSTYVTVRFLDPNKQKGAKKTFFNPNIFQELDKHYSR